MSVSVEEQKAELLDLQEKLLKIANLQADNTLKAMQETYTRTQEAYAHVQAAYTQTQNRLAPWQLVVSAATAGAALAGAFTAAGVALAHWL